jgi:hypothetical protein
MQHILQAMLHSASKRSAALSQLTSLSIACHVAAAGASPL